MSNEKITNLQLLLLIKTNTENVDGDFARAIAQELLYQRELNLVLLAEADKAISDLQL